MNNFIYMGQLDALGLRNLFHSGSPFYYDNQRITNY